MVPVILQSYLPEVLHGHFVALLALYSPVVQRQGDVLHGVLEPDQVERLEDEANEFVAHHAGIVFRKVLDEPSGQTVFTFIVIVQYAYDVQQGALARA